MTDKYKLGLVSVSFRGHTPREILEEMKKVGLSCIEWGSDVHAPCTDVSRLYEIAALQKEYEITCSSYGTYFRLGETPLDELEKYVIAAKILNTDVLRLWCGKSRGSDMTKSERDELLRTCRSAALIAKENGVKLCLECHKGTYTESPDDASRLIRAVDSEHFKMYWQPFQWQSPVQNVENAKIIAPYAVHIHVFNWKNDKKLSLSESVHEWQKYLSVFSTPRTLLLEFMPNGTLAELKKETSALRTITGEEI